MTSDPRETVRRRSRILRLLAIGALRSARRAAKDAESLGAVDAKADARAIPDWSPKQKAAKKEKPVAPSNKSKH